jgi:hypothetical protein
MGAMHVREQQTRANNTWDGDGMMNGRQDMRDDGHDSPPFMSYGRGIFNLTKLKLLPQPPHIMRGVYIFYVYVAYYSPLLET